MRIPYAPTAPADPSPSNLAIYDRIAARRHPRPLTKLDLALLHNPAIADGYNSLMGAVRTASSLPASLMELSICCVAVHTKAVYEWKAHSALALKAGVNREKLQKLLDGAPEGDEALFDETERAVLAYARQSTLDVRVDDALFERLRRCLGGDDRKVMELAITVAGYNMVSRFLVGLDVTESNNGEMVVPEAA